MSFKEFADDIRKNEWNVFGAELYEDGVLTHTYGDTRNELHEIYSATKTILSIAVGIAVGEKRFDISKPILSYLPAGKVGKLSADQKEAFSSITVERLLAMSVAGLPFRAEGDSYIDVALNVKLPNPGERTFNYSNICSHLVAVALTEVLGTDLGGFIEERIFRPLGIDRYEYARCPEGYFYGASGVKLTVNELSRIGLLLYNKGTFDGQRIVSEEYVRTATSVHQMCREGGYGYFIWKYRDGFSINGRLGQKCYVLPNQKLIVSYLCHIEDEFRDLLNSMERNILGVNV